MKHFGVKRNKKMSGRVVLAHNFLLCFNTDEQKYLNCRTQPLILLVWQRSSAQSREVRPPRYWGNTTLDKNTLFGINTWMKKKLITY